MAENHDDLKKQVAELRATLEGLVESTQTESVRIGVENAELRAAVLGIQMTLDDVHATLVGSSGDGVVDVVSRLLQTVEGLGRIFETLRLEGQSKDTAFAALVAKWQASNPWREVALLSLSLFKMQLERQH